MEPRFEMRFYCTYKSLVEFARKYTTGCSWPRILTLCVCCVVVFSFLGISKEYIQLFAIECICVLTAILYPHIWVWIAQKNDKKQNDGVQPEVIVTFGDIVEMHEGMVHLTIPYQKIVRVVRLKHSYALMLGKRNGVMLYPDYFTKGNFEEFKQFLREKRPDLNIPE